MNEYIVSTLFGFEEIVAAEIKELGYQDVEILNRAVSVKADDSFMYKANLHLRTAIRILLKISSFKTGNQQDLFDGAYKIDWNEYLDPDMTFAVQSVAYSEQFKHSGFVSLRVKDAIVDKIRSVHGRRPNVDTQNPDVLINVHIDPYTTTISLDSSGIPLYMRGYRIITGAAPISEVLAAGIIKMTGWTPEQVFVDPMCGSGTFLIEAALIAKDSAPGLSRNHFGFYRWKSFQKKFWTAIVEEAKSKVKHCSAEIIGYDISRMAINKAKQNLIGADVIDEVKLRVVDIKKLIEHEGPGVLITNPPYDERLKHSDIDELYGAIGTTFKHKFNNYKAFIISSNTDALKRIGLKHFLKKELYNGKLQCQLRGYEIYSGSRKAGKISE